MLAIIFFLLLDRATESELADHLVFSDVPGSMLSCFLEDCSPLIVRREFSIICLEVDKPLVPVVLNELFSPCDSFDIVFLMLSGFWEEESPLNLE